jgi:hypothetical protein
LRPGDFDWVRFGPCSVQARACRKAEQLERDVRRCERRFFFDFGPLICPVYAGQWSVIKIEFFRIKQSL